MIEALMSIKRCVWLGSGDRVSVVLMKSAESVEKSGRVSVSTGCSPPIIFGITEYCRSRDRRARVATQPFQLRQPRCKVAGELFGHAINDDGFSLHGDSADIRVWTCTFAFLPL
jgi:hypothetical protein